MASNKEVKDFERLLRKHGLTIKIERGHHAIRNERGKRVGTLSSSPHGDIRFAIKNTTKQLRANGAIRERERER